MRRAVTFGGSSLAALAVLAATGAGALGATLTVNKRGDSVPGACTPGDCTLREAILAAGAAPGADRIVLPARKPYRVTRPFNAGNDDAAGDLDVHGPGAVAIVHPGPRRAVIDASGADDRVLQVHGQAMVVLRRLVLTGGEAQFNQVDSGGGIRAEGPLTLDRVRVIGNETGDGSGGGVAVTDSVPVTIRRTTIAANRSFLGAGGGLSNASGAPVRVIRSTVSGNRARLDGGGISNTGTIGIVNATIAGNSVDGRGGGLYGGPASSASLNAVTIARNRADANNAGSAGGGGIWADGGGDVVAVANSLIARNRTTGGAPGDCDAPAPVGIDSAGGNLITTTSNGCDFFTHPRDIVRPKPRIGKLRPNGGPTATIALLRRSPAIDRARRATAPARDQRGRKRGKRPDIGAYERG